MFKTFEFFDFDDDTNDEDLMYQWLEDNGFEKGPEGWSSESLYTIYVPDHMINDDGYLKVNFYKVLGTFEIDSEKLKSLKNCPVILEDNFEITNTKINNLDFYT